jgi:hypothetical protein
MHRLALINFIIGFSVLFLAAAAGAFIANDLSEAFIRDRELLNSWNAVLTRSAHGHTNLFGMLHICFGLTIPYSVFSVRIKKLQTFGLIAGTFAMGPLMMLRASTPPSEGVDVTAILIGCCLSLALATIFSHTCGLLGKYMNRE